MTFIEKNASDYYKVSKYLCMQYFARKPSSYLLALFYFITFMLLYMNAILSNKLQTTIQVDSNL